MQALGPIGKLLSGPWMKTFYTSADDQLNLVDSIEVVKNVVSVLEGCDFDPTGVFYRQTDFFGRALDDDDECSRDESNFFFHHRGTG